MLNFLQHHPRTLPQQAEMSPLPLPLPDKTISELTPPETPTLRSQTPDQTEIVATPQDN